MNIFHVLTQGNSTLHEPSMSAILGYLLDSHKDHGLGDAVIRKFLQAQNNPSFNEILNEKFIYSYVTLEETMDLDGKNVYFDIWVNIQMENKETFTVLIENKIRASAANSSQLSDYYAAILQEDQNIKNLHIVFGAVLDNR